MTLAESSNEAWDAADWNAIDAILQRAQALRPLKPTPTWNPAIDAILGRAHALRAANPTWSPDRKVWEVRFAERVNGPRVPHDLPGLREDQPERAKAIARIVSDKLRRGEVIWPGSLRARSRVAVHVNHDHPSVTRRRPPSRTWRTV